MRIVTSGASGLIGRKLCAFFTARGDRVVRLVRRPAVSDDEIAWDPARGELDAAALDGADAVVNLSGANVAEGRWTDARKQELRDSRLQTTSLLARTMAASANKPKIFVSASAIGWYGAREEDVDERSPRGQGFLAELCAEWEAAAEPARAAGIRVVHPRIGIVLDRGGGALKKMLPVFRFGAGAQLGDGTAALSWITLDDVIGALAFAMARRLDGPINLTAPAPTTQRDFAKALGRALHRPVFLRLPGAILRLAVGEMAESVLAGARIFPWRLIEEGFQFAHPSLPGALDHVLAVHSAA
ncbi:MAG TPA: TIGR01777 family oxidoreductase [Polyangia bacterium]|jgi:hypothetical protein